MTDVEIHPDSDFIIFLSGHGIPMTSNINRFYYISITQCNLCHKYLMDKPEFWSIEDRIETYAEHYVYQHSYLGLEKSDKIRHKWEIETYNRTWSMLQQLLIYARNWNTKAKKLKRGSAVWSLQKEFQIPMIVLNRILGVSQNRLGELAYNYVESINGLPSWAK